MSTNNFTTRELDSDHIEKLLYELLPSLKPTKNRQAMALCPFHDDHDPSLSVNLDNGVYNCFACGAKGTIIGLAAQVWGTDHNGVLNRLTKDTGTLEVPQQITDRHLYYNELGDHIYTKERLEPGKNGRTKEFRFRQPNGGYGRKENPVLYNLPAVMAADLVFITEGEKHADKLGLWDLIGTTLDSGANSSSTKTDLTALHGKHIVILPDNDSPGADYASMLAQALDGHAANIKVIDLPGLPQKGDLMDWPGTKDQLLELVDQANQWKPEAPDLSFLRSGGEIAAMNIPITWVVDNVVPEGAVVLFYARGGIGKSTLLTMMAGCISGGKSFFRHETTQRQVIYIDYENSLAVLCHRLKKIDADKVLFWDSSNCPTHLDREGMDQLRHMVQAYDRPVLIIDTLRSAQGGDENDSRAMSEVMGFLRELRDIGTTVILLHHTPKASDSKYKGSSAIFDMVDHVLAMYPVKQAGDDSEDQDADEDEAKVYRFGTKDKTRYKPYRMFLQFSAENEVFEEVPDPAQQSMDDIRRLMIEMGGRVKQREIVEQYPTLGLSRNKTQALLQRGDGKYWVTERVKAQKNALFYTPILFSSFPHTKGLENGETGPDTSSEEQQTPQPEPQGITGQSKFASFPDHQNQDGKVLHFSEEQLEVEFGG